jgi:hypothetical protein
MDFLNKLKQHYEKIILAAVLLGLAGAAAWLPFKVSSVRTSLEEATQGYTNKKRKPLDPVVLTTNEVYLARMEKPGKATFANPGHNLFNPIRWLKRGDGTPVPSTDLGVNRLTVTNITPLYLKIVYLTNRVSGGNLRYEFQVTRQAATNSALQQPVRRLAEVGQKNETFLLKGVQGPKEDPEGLELEVADFNNLAVTVSKAEPFSRVAGYSADLYYETDRKTHARQRVGYKLTLEGVAYNIIDIGPAEVTLEDNKTKKRTTIRWNGAP